MRQLITLAVSAAVLAILWWHVDVQSLWQAALNADAWWVLAGILTMAPLTLGAALRFRLISRTPISLALAGRLILSAATLNLVLPSKLGDLAKAWVLVRQHGFKTELALAIVVLERILDLASLLFWGIIALFWISAGAAAFAWLGAGLAILLIILVFLLTPFRFTHQALTALAGRLPGRAREALLKFAATWGEVTHWFWGDRRRAIGTLLFSLALWGGHLVQFWLFARALGYVPLIDNMAFAAASILVGLLPFTIAGIGTRDAAIVFFYGAWLTPGQGAVLGLLASLRYVIPAVAGLPFISDFWAAARFKEQLK